MSFLYQFRKKLKDKRNQQQTNVHPINISIRGDYDVVISQIFHRIFNIQRSLQQVEFLVFVNYFFGHSVGIQRFSTKGKNSLRIYITAFGYTSTRRISLGYKKG